MPKRKSNTADVIIPELEAEKESYTDGHHLYSEREKEVLRRYAYLVPWESLKPHMEHFRTTKALKRKASEMRADPSVQMEVDK